MEKSKNTPALLQAIPEEKLGTYLKRYIEKVEKHERTISVCPECGKVIETYDYPYGYDEKNNDVWFASVCPECGAVIYSKE